MRVSAIDATTNAIDRSSHTLWLPETLIHSISLGSLCHGLIMQTIYSLVKGFFASIMGTYTHFRDFGDRYVMKPWHICLKGSVLRAMLWFDDICLAGGDRGITDGWPETGFFEKTSSQHQKTHKNLLFMVWDDAQLFFGRDWQIEELENATEIENFFLATDISVRQRLFLEVVEVCYLRSFFLHISAMQYFLILLQKNSKALYN